MIRKSSSFPLGRNSEHASFSAKIVITVIVAAQFVDITLGSVGGFVLSAQKLSAMLVLPIGLLALKRIVFPPQLAIVGISLLVAYSVAPISGIADSSGWVSAIAALAMSVVAASVLISALAEGDGIVVFARTWLALAVFTAVICAAQATGALPLFAVTEDVLYRREVVAGFTRATGFKFDPNFAAMMLVVGLVFCRSTVTKSVQRNILTLVLLIGIVSTFSRMGIIIAVLVLVSSASGNSAPIFGGTKVAKYILNTGLASLFGLILYVLSPAALRIYVSERSGDLAAAVATILGNDVTQQGGSGQERVLLLEYTMRAIAENWLVGIGPGNLEGYLANSIGVDKGAHNTYLEVIAIGGVFGALALIAYAIVSFRAVRLSSSTEWSDIRRNRMLRQVVLSIGAMAFVLTLSYNFLLLLPLALMLGNQERTKFARAATLMRTTLEPA